MTKAERLLVYGFCCMTLGAGLFQLVIIGLIGIVLFAVAIVLLISGVVGARAAELPPKDATSGLIFFIGGLVLISVAAESATSLAYDVAIHKLHPASRLPALSEWLMIAILSFASSLAIAFGLRFRTRWSWSRCLLWEASIFCVCPVAIAIFFVLATIWPITA